MLRPVAAACLSLFSSAAFASETITYTYDALGRLVTVARTGTVNNGTTATYTYDKADNRSNVTVTGASSSCTNSTPQWGTGTYGCMRWGQ